MKTYKLHTLNLRIVCAAAFISLCTSVVLAQPASQVGIQEAKQKTAAVAAPNECLDTFRALFRYLQKSEPSIVRDEQAQKRWLTQELQKALVQKVATFTSPADDPDFPSNGTFIGTWDYPSTYTIVASRRYGKRAIVDVLYKWGPKTNYPGNERVTSFVFQLEDGAWKLDDIYNLREKFASPGSLHQYFVVAK